MDKCTANDELHQRFSESSVPYLIRWLSCRGAYSLGVAFRLLTRHSAGWTTAEDERQGDMQKVE
jgi:hypothetical protein